MIKEIYIVLKLRQFKHRITYKYEYPRMKSAIKRYKYCEDKKSKKQIREEIELCKKYWGCYPLHYFRYNLYKKNNKINERGLINYIPEFFFYKLFLTHYDSEKYSVLLCDKNITEQLFRSVNIEQPYTICKVINGKTYDRLLNEKTFNEINHELNENIYKKIFIKPTDGEGGHGIMIFNLREKHKYANRNNEEFNEAFISAISEKNNYIIQAGVNQNSSIAAIYEDAVNTFRIATENVNGKVRVICSVLRIGRYGSEVDNCSQGGIALGIDDNTGVCKAYAISEDGEIFYKHPDTGFIFENYKIDKWSSIRNFTIDCAAKLPQFTYLGWDIALTEDKPIAIETNLGFGIDLYQFALGGLREVFEINEPDKYWKNGRYKFDG